MLKTENEAQKKRKEIFDLQGIFTTCTVTFDGRVLAEIMVVWPRGEHT